MDPRQVRGRLLAESQDKRIKHVEGPLWFVPSQREGGYLVNVAAGTCVSGQPGALGSTAASGLARARIRAGGGRERGSCCQDGAGSRTGCAETVGAGRIRPLRERKARTSEPKSGQFGAQIRPAPTSAQTRPAPDGERSKLICATNHFIRQTNSSME